MKKPHDPPPPTPTLSTEDQPIVPPPASMTVDFQRKPVLYTLDGRPLSRKVGF